MGSGKALKRAIRKYGIENFKREVIAVFSTEEQMNLKEAELVTEEYCNRKNTYNICPGGKGGFGYINKNKLNLTGKHTEASLVNIQKATIALRILEKDDKFLEKRAEATSKSLKKRFSEKPHQWLGRKHTEETKRKISKSRLSLGKKYKNSQYGTCWITNGQENKKIKKETLDSWIKQGYYRGRV